MRKIIILVVAIITLTACKKIEKEGFNFDYNNICRALENIYLEEINKDNMDDVPAREYV